jgi:ADP-heptose:LPS heptosyltransferase
MKTDHLLIIRFSALGDVAMTVPVIYSLAHQYPNLRITVLSNKMMRPLFDNISPNVGFMEADVKTEYKGIKGLNCLYRRLTAKNFTAIADFHNVLRSEYLRMRFNIGRYKVAHINKHRSGKRKLVAEDNKVLVQQPTSFQNYADVLAQLGYPIKIEFTSIFPPTGGNMRLIPASIGTKKAFQQWIGIAPFAAHNGKIYPIEHTEKVIAAIKKSHPSCWIFFFGGGNKEKKTMNDWCTKYSQCVNASEKLAGLEQELILMSHLDVMISMDSANMHLASLVNTPVVSVWGATHPYGGFMGWNQDPNNAVQLDLPCRPCSIYGKKPCIRGDYACLNNISPELILNKVENLLNK